MSAHQTGVAAADNFQAKQEFQSGNNILDPARRLKWEHDPISLFERDVLKIDSPPNHLTAVEEAQTPSNCSLASRA
jgi:hypothetical protein